MFKVLNEIRNDNPKLKIIIGIDANQDTFAHPNNKFTTFPNPANHKSTSTKKRTRVQVQFHKA